MGRQMVAMAEFVERWTLVGAGEERLIKGKRRAPKLEFALLLKFYTTHGRFPRGRAELPDEVVDYVASQVEIPASGLGFYAWSGSTFDQHGKQIRGHLGFQECSVADAYKLTNWLAGQVGHAERDAEKLRVELAKEMRERRIEPSTDGRIGRIVASAVSQVAETWLAAIKARIDTAGAARALALVGWGAEEPDDGEDIYESPESVWARIRSALGKVSLDSLMAEPRKLLAACGFGVPIKLSADLAPKVLAGLADRPDHPVLVAPPPYREVRLNLENHLSIGECSTPAYDELMVCLGQCAAGCETPANPGRAEK